MKILTDNKAVNTVVLIPAYLFAVSCLAAVVFTWFNLKTSSNVLFVLGMIFVNISWIYLSRNIKVEEKAERKKKDNAAFGMLFYSGVCFLFSYVFSAV